MTTQPDLLAWQPREHGDRDGRTYDRPRDRARLDSQASRVLAVLNDGEWHTLAELLEKCGGRETALSARLRDLRKPRFGGHTVQASNRGGGVWAYRLVKP